MPGIGLLSSCGTLAAVAPGSGAAGCSAAPEHRQAGRRLPQNVAVIQMSLQDYRLVDCAIFATKGWAITGVAAPPSTISVLVPSFP
jgi:hypothetical protein